MLRRRLFLLLTLAVAGCGDTTSPDGAAAQDLAKPVNPDLAVAASADLAAPSPDLAAELDSAMPPAPSCMDGVKNGDESDVDCGGATCTKCGDGKECKAGADCASAACAMGKCATPSCMDGQKNGAETDVDCGGTCPKCDDQKKCAAAGDCKSGNCMNGACAAATCMDGIKNDDETDADCGGPRCPKCGDGKGCSGAGDCSGDSCVMGKCAQANCQDLTRNGSETDVDCGGPCPKCKDGQGCKASGDCGSGLCANGRCAMPTCQDAIKNGLETDTDCGGGSCPKCEDGQGCAANGDCTGGVCSGGKCATPSCMDGVKNGGETDVDCGGKSCGNCKDGQACAVAGDCASKLCGGGVCRTAASCLGIKMVEGGAPSGVYTVDPDGAMGPIAPFAAYCDMVADGGGWTLAAKIDGAKSTWVYAAAIWTDATTSGANDLSLNEAKLPAFNSLPFSTARLVMRDAGTDRAARVTPAMLPMGATLRSVFTGDKFYPTNLGRFLWLQVLSNGSIQTRCGQEGFNNAVNGQRMRLGIFGNQENDCNTCDSFIGVGYQSLASGNIAAAPWDDSGLGGRNTQSFSFLFIR